MRLNTLIKSAAVAMVAAGALGMASTSASALTLTSNGPLTSVSAAAGATKLVVASSPATGLRCTNSTAFVDVLGSYAGGNPLTIGTNVVPVFTGCTVIPIGTPATVVCDPKPNATVLQATGTTAGGVTPGHIARIRCTVTVSASCTAVVTSPAADVPGVTGSYSNTGVLSLNGPQNLTLTASCPSNILRSGSASFGGDTPALNPPALPHNYTVTSTPIPNVVVTP